MPVSALQVAKSNTEKYFADAAESVRDVAAKRLTPVVDDILFTNLRADRAHLPAFKRQQAARDRARPLRRGEQAL